MIVEIFTKRDCPTCESTKNLLRTNNVEYVEYLIGYDIMREDVLSKFPGVKNAPIIVINGCKLGGYPELKNIIDNRQLGVFLNG